MAMACVSSPEKWKNGGKKPRVADDLARQIRRRTVLAPQLELGVAVLVDAVAVRDDVRVASRAAAAVARDDDAPVGAELEVPGVARDGQRGSASTAP